ncbi:unnamed protein product, partial [Ascophyllum nodosum]
ARTILGRHGKIHRVEYPALEQTGDRSCKGRPRHKLRDRLQVTGADSK